MFYLLVTDGVCDGERMEHFWYNEETTPYYPSHHALVGVPFSG